MRVRISRPGVYIPSEILTNGDLEKLVDTSDEWIRTRSGIIERRISLDKNNRQMAVAAAKDLFSKEQFNPEEIGEIIYSTNRHDEDKDFPSHAGYVAHHLGIKEGAIVHDDTAGCTGLVYAIRQAYNNILSGDVKKVLVIGSEWLTDMTDYSDRATCVLFGDGACAYLLEETNDEGIIKNVLGGKPDVPNVDWPNGQLGLIQREGVKLGARYNGEFKTYRKEQNYLVMDGKAVFKFATVVMTETIKNALDGTDYTIRDIDWIIPHQANDRIIQVSVNNLKEFGFKGRVAVNVDRYGNTSTASIGLAANEAIEIGVRKDGNLRKLRRGDLVMHVSFGAGFTYGANLFRAS